jgi:hypothetical protein
LEKKSINTTDISFENHIIFFLFIQFYYIMSPEMLMQPLEQSFTTLPMTNGYYQHSNEEEYLFGYPQQSIDGNGDFRPTFYNPFEIKHRRRTSRAQLKVLEKSFSENPKPNAAVRRILAQKLDMTPRGVQIWFQNRRAKAKLQRRKSGEENDESNVQHQQQQQASPVLFNQFFNNLKAWDNSARSIATAAAASCIYDPTSSSVNDSNLLVDHHQQTSVKMEEWFKMPIHPLAPVIEQSDDFDFSSPSLMSSEEWRRKSCPALGSKALKQGTYEQPMFSLSYPMENNNYHVSFIFQMQGQCH